jgi:hypothetical protein
MTEANLSTTVKGHVLIKDKATGEVLLDKNNAVHVKNMSMAIARGLAHDTTPATITLPGGSASASVGTNQILAIKLGNGGTTLDALNAIVYQAPNVTGNAADLYSATYGEIVDATVTGAGAGNSVTWTSSPSPDLTSIVTATMTISANEPSNQDITDSTDTNPNAQYAFDELGLFCADPALPAGRLLTHIVFSPILKTANRELVITYTLTISVS